uniref:Uncharacterized protein n=1 Tax=Quercus lobata TaxID=97700 RepID=A0A7N2KTK6_QUELO
MTDGGIKLSGEAQQADGIIKLKVILKLTENLQQWLIDEKARDQFVIRAGSDTKVLWNDTRHLKPEPVYKRAFTGKVPLFWVVPVPLIALCFILPQVKLIDFSPSEKYLVTYSSQEPSNPRDANSVVINIFDVRTGKVLRDFKGNADDFAIGGTCGVTGVSWPVFRWAGGKEDKYFARIGKNIISVYETETFSLIDKKSLKVENVVDFSWSQTNPILGLFVPELGDHPARVSTVV